MAFGFTTQGFKVEGFGVQDLGLRLGNPGKASESVERLSRQPTTLFFNDRAPKSSNFLR